MTSLTVALSAALLHFVWQGTVSALLLWVALALTRKQPPSVRYAICCVGLGLMAAMPVVTMWLLYQPTPSAAFQGIFVWRGAAFPISISAFQPASWFDLGWFDLARRWALAVWATGVIVFSLRLVWFCGQAAWLRRQGELAGQWLGSKARELGSRMGVTRRFRVLISAKAEGPSVIGWVRPVIVVPAAVIAGLTPQQLEAVLAHELAHIRRADYLVNLLQSAIEALLFYHPAVWWVSGRIRYERELCCDDLAVRSCGDALMYARALSILERLRMSPPRMAMAGTGGPLLYRIRRIVGAEGYALGTSKAPGLVALTIVLVLGAVGLKRAEGQAPPPLQALSQQQSAPVGVPAQPRKTPVPKASVKTMAPDTPEAEDQAVVEDLRRRLAELSVTYSANHPKIRQLQQMIENAEAHPEAADTVDSPMNSRTRADIARLQNLIALNASGQANIDDAEQRRRISDELLTLETQLAYLRNELKLSESMAATDPSPEVEEITVAGLSSEAQRQILSRLPLHIGSRLSSSVIRDCYLAVSAFDKNLEFAIVMLSDGKGELRITPKK